MENSVYNQCSHMYAEAETQGSVNLALTNYFINVCCHDINIIQFTLTEINDE